MSMLETPSAERIRISFFGRTNAGKSSLLNAVTAQNISVVSNVKGTTTDPVSKAMELLPAGPVIITDTPGSDDTGELGKLRIEKTNQIINKTDLAVLVIDSTIGISSEDIKLKNIFLEKNIEYIIAFTMADKLDEIPDTNENSIYVSSSTGFNISKLKEMIAEKAIRDKQEKRLIGHLINTGDIVILVTPIDEAAPKGRLILPQQQTTRDILDSHAIPILVQPKELKSLLDSLPEPPVAVITDSQAFKQVADIVPDSILLTSFSIIFAEYKGILRTAVAGLKKLSELKDGDKVLISEGCTHHRQCGDIGTVKLPALINKYTGVKPQYEFTSGTYFPENLEEYSLIIHCGGCMISSTEIKHRCMSAQKAGIAFTNYGTAISFMNGILERTLRIFPDIKI